MAKRVLFNPCAYRCTSSIDTMANKIERNRFHYLMRLMKWPVLLWLLHCTMCIPFCISHTLIACKLKQFVSQQTFLINVDVLAEINSIAHECIELETNNFFKPLIADDNQSPNPHAFPNIIVIIIACEPLQKPVPDWNSACPMENFNICSVFWLFFD